MKKRVLVFAFLLIIFSIVAILLFNLQRLSYKNVETSPREAGTQPQQEVTKTTVPAPAENNQTEEKGEEEVELTFEQAV